MRLNSTKIAACCLLGCTAFAWSEFSLHAAEQEPKKNSPTAIEFFEAKIRPVLVANCYSCHSIEAGKAEGSLRLDSRAAIRAGGDRGPAVVPGDPDASWLIKAIQHAEDDLKMPPKKERLSVAVIADFTTWIRAGAADPRDGDAKPLPKKAIDYAAARNFWAYRKPVATPLPDVRDAIWARRDLDRYVLARLEAAKLSPSPDAAPVTLLRRLYFDLVGLPPSPEQIDAFLQRFEKEGFDLAWAAEVDALLASPAFGERWGRHWLDVARYAESSGKEANMTFPYAFRYRDYVIDAINADLPYDRFLTEQIAGDLLSYDSDSERARLLIATGYLAIGPKNLDEANPAQFAADVVDEQIDTVTRSVLGNSVACARCHDHKFDPFAMTDYYALAGVFTSTKTYFGTYVTPINRLGGDPLVLPAGAKQPIYHTGIPAPRVATLKTELASLKQQQADGLKAVMKAVAAGDDPEKSFSLRDALRIFWTSGGIEGQLEKVDDEGKPLPLAMGVLDAEKIGPTRLLERGEVSRPGPQISRAFPQVIELDGAKLPHAKQSGRLEFAAWLTHPDHPLTARVYVNRAWRHLFGAGLVATIDNFGTSGEKPSHPELLDHLALKFVKDGWSLKRLVREIVLSRTYRQDSTHRADAFQIDPDNRLLWRMSKRRLEAEAIRDAMLVAAGELDRSPPEGSLVAKKLGDKPVSLVGLDPSLPPDLDGSTRRSVYLPILRDRLPDILDLFDFAEPSLVVGDRATTNVPVQALYLMNSPWVQARAKALAARLRNHSENTRERVQFAYRICFGRAAEDAEVDKALAFLDRASATKGSGKGPPSVPWVAYCQALMATAEFRNVD